MLVSFLSIVFIGTEYVNDTRKRRRYTSSNAAISHITYEVNVPGLQRPKPIVQRPALPIPRFMDAYNYGVNRVDGANQYRAEFETSLSSSRNWLCLLFWLLDTTIVNSYLLRNVILRRVCPKM